MRENDEGLVQVYVELTENELFGGESFWAKPVGDNLYEVRNIPFAAYNVNLYDVVLALAPASDQKPRLIDVVRRSGHRTLRFVFAESTAEENVRHILEGLEGMNVRYERGFERLYAIDVERDDDLESVCEYLEIYEQQGLLEYETTETESRRGFTLEPDSPVES